MHHTSTVDKSRKIKLYGSYDAMSHWKMEGFGMRIERTKVINVDKYLGALPQKGTFKLIVQLEEPVASKLARCGFDPAPENGATVLPAVVGRVS